MRIIPKLLVVVLPALLVLSGCETTGEAEPDQGAPAVGGAAAGDASASAASTPTATATPVKEPEVMKDPLEEGLLAARVVYFDYDSSAIVDAAMPMLKAHAEYLAANGNSITVEGHCDERGTREYNIALGERRADAVRRVLLANGVSGNQIKIVSYGEERPAQLGHDESAWSKNRRSELMY
jgi:peptidoglycan-associated lipoprotein